MNKTELELPELIMDRVRERIKIGLKASSQFQIKMTIQSMFDQRALFAKLIQIFNVDGLNEVDGPKYDYPTLCRFYASGFINNVLKHFQSASEHLGKAGSLKVPPVGLFFEEKKGEKSMAEKHADLRKRQRFEREELAKKARRD